jgi:DNA invertase Pin-like site-specific DNA recombinase
MDRPGLAQLLAEIEAGKIDIVVVYKVDRLTRALSDFARIVEIFDKRGVSFVSVTQAFNTTSSMGRLTLNVLLSFAQFEREVTGERIRDKVAASKAKGMWMGGNVPLGYDIPTDRVSRALVVNPAEAETVRFIFRRYLELGSVRALAVDLDDRGLSTKRRIAGSGREIGGHPWREGPLYYFLRNRIYRGDIVHKGRIHPGQHEPIVDAELFDQVQARLAAGGRRHHTEANARIAAALVGKIFDDRGHPMSPVTARRGARTYRYYVSQAVIRRDRGEPGTVKRIPAHAIEELIEAELSRRCLEAEVVVQRVAVSAAWVDIALTSARPGAPGASGDVLVVRVPATLRTWGGAKQLIGAEGRAVERREPDRALLRAIARAKRWETQLATGERAGADDIAANEGVESRYVDKLLKLAWLPPDTVEALLDGRRLIETSLTQLIESRLALEWPAQRRSLVFARSDQRRPPPVWPAQSGSI